MSAVLIEIFNRGIQRVEVRLYFGTREYFLNIYIYKYYKMRKFIGILVVKIKTDFRWLYYVER